MTEQRFMDKLKIIKKYRDEINRMEKFLSEMAGTTVMLENLYYHIDELMLDFAKDLHFSKRDIETRLSEELDLEDISYIIFESDYGRRDLCMSINNIYFDCTIFNLYLANMNKLDEDSCDSFEHPKYIL